MNTLNLQENYQKLLEYMENENYSKLYTKCVERIIHKIISNPDSWETYQDLYHEYVDKSAASTHQQHKAVIGAIMRFDLFGEYPNSTHYALINATSYAKLISNFKQLIDYYVNIENNRTRIKESTIKRNASCVSSFLLAMQERGKSILSDITEDDVLSAFVTAEGIPLRSPTIAYCIKDVLGVCADIFPDECHKITKLIPKIKRVKKNYPYLTQQETHKLREIFDNESHQLSLRDKAIGILAYYTGLRWCDISSLTLDSIDWECDIIKIKQQKTGVPLELPLISIVGNAIHDYLINERPQINNNILFLTADCHPRKIGQYSQKRISLNIMNQAGIRQNKGDRRGIHIFRHNLATTLLENSIPQPIISSALGQLAPKSLEVYISTDIENLRTCALSVEQFSSTLERGVL